jgi:starch phosphorylase
MEPYAKDPVCGMPLHMSTTLVVHRDGEQFLFCSEFCKQAFEWNVESYLRHATAPTADEVAAKRRIAYFSMEIAIDPRMPTYSGGLGVLAGDTLRSFADVRVPAVGLTLLYRKGYFAQALDQERGQVEAPESWSPEAHLRPLRAEVEVAIEGRPVRVHAWQYDVVGVSGFLVPVLLLDTDLAVNADQDRHLTDYLYGGDERYRLAQEIVLGIGGLRLLAAAGYAGIEKLHLNEGHAALAALELLRTRARGPSWDFEGVQRQCVFTTHTPVAAGHDQFRYELAEGVLGDLVPRDLLRMLAGGDALNMTRLALNLSGHINGVARKHREVSRGMFPGYEIGNVTNGVHSATWTSPSFQALFDRWVPGWREDPAMLRQAAALPSEAIAQAHAVEKQQLLEEVRERTGRALDPGALTIGFARRAAEYKRADLLFRDLGRLRALSRTGRLQLVFAGKAHPRDGGGKELIRRVLSFARQLGDEIPVVYLPNYDLTLARRIVSGVDLWLNTPQRPLEASGTSGMKAAHNGVPSLSVLDGWWIEGHVEGATGWSIGELSDRVAGDATDQRDAEDLYAKLAVILHLFYNEPERWTSVMKLAIALNASFFNTHRMVYQYATSAYLG